mmetsp:Transcript_47740/g.76019  ORF Transcript_47740/g.76019 Transcript_47740/m.76019 type:complete len:124 (+) Transcript_47740:43-414(+)
MEAAVKELKDNIRQSARRAEEQIDARVAEVAQSLQQLEMERRELQKAKRELEDERAQLLQMQDYFNDQQQELEHLKAEVNKSRRAGGLFGCCMAPAIADRTEDPGDPGVTGRPPELYGGPEPP